MKYLSEKKALQRLAEIKTDLKEHVSDYERLAKSCATCETQGACCLDAHFVNVRISRLEAIAIEQALAGVGTERRNEVERRIADAIARYQLTAEGDAFEQKFACPLFEKGTGCLVHHHGKPAACIVHACYEREADLPPDELLHGAEQSIDALNARTYGRSQPWLPLPLALSQGLD